MYWRFQAQGTMRRAAWALLALGRYAPWAAAGPAADTSAGRPQKKGVGQKMRTDFITLVADPIRQEPS